MKYKAYKGVKIMAFFRKERFLWQAQLSPLQ
jgi:hypothetical protein